MALSCLVLAVGAAASMAETLDLSDADRENLRKYFGDAITVKAIDAKPIEDPRGYLVRKDGAQWNYQVTHGSDQGRTGTATLHRGSSEEEWRFDTNADSVVHIRWNDDGSVVVAATEDRKNKVISRYDPPEPLLLKGLKPGESREMTLQVGVYDAKHPDHKSHSGKLDLTYTYVGAFEVKVPAGTFETVLIRWLYKGKVGPASVNDHQYWFLAKGQGPVAMIEKSDISAVLFYKVHEKHASVLTEAKESAVPHSESGDSRGAGRP